MMTQDDDDGLPEEEGDDDEGEEASLLLGEEEEEDEEDLQLIPDLFGERISLDEEGGHADAPLQPSRGQQFATKAARAPVGGVDVQGTHYPGGQFIPKEVMARATPEEKAAVEGRGGDGGAGKKEADAAAPKKRAGLFGRIMAGISAAIGKKEGPRSHPWKDVARLSVAERVDESPPRDEFVQALEADPHRKAQWEYVANKNGKTVEETKKEVAQKLNKMIEPLRVSMRFKYPQTLEKVLDSGQFKNQFHPGITSDAALNDRNLRSMAEEKSMGVPPDAPPDDRPIYGYLTYPDNAAAGVPRTLDAAQAYGDWIVNFKPEVKQRMTVSYGDSLMGAVNKEFVACAPGEAHPESIHPNTLAARGMDILDDFTKFDQEGRIYIEAHVQGRTDLSHVESIDFPKHSPPSDVMKQKMTAAGIKWNVY